MVFFFHTTYAKDDLTYLISLHPDYELYEGGELREKDTLIIAVYFSYTSMEMFLYLKNIYTKDKARYNKIIHKVFSHVDANIDLDDGGREKGIFHPEIISLLTRENSKLLLYNSWETRNLYSCIPIICYYCRYHNIPCHKLLLSMTDHQHMFKRFPYPRVISYDWQFIHAKMNFSRESIVDQQTPKSKHLICFNSRSNDERLAAVTYLYTRHREKCHLSFLNRKGSPPNAGKMLSLVKHFVPRHKFLSFKEAIPLSLERGLQESIADAYILLMLETNIVRRDCQQISEKTYRPIIAGIPFLLWASQGGILAHLRKMGFQTFAPHINEEYDNSKYTYMERYVRLINEVERLCSLDIDEIKSLYRRCLPIVEHNFTILESREHVPDLL